MKIYVALSVESLKCNLLRKLKKSHLILEKKKSVFKKSLVWEFAGVLLLL